MGSFSPQQGGNSQVENRCSHILGGDNSEIVSSDICAVNNDLREYAEYSKES